MYMTYRIHFCEVSANVSKLNSEHTTQTLLRSAINANLLKYSTLFPHEQVLSGFSSVLNAMPRNFRENLDCILNLNTNFNLISFCSTSHITNYR